MAEACLHCGAVHSDAIDGESTFSGAIPWRCRRCPCRMWSVWKDGSYIMTLPMQESMQEVLLQYSRDHRDDAILRLIGFF